MGLLEMLKNIAKVYNNFSNRPIAPAPRPRPMIDNSINNTITENDNPQLRRDALISNSSVPLEELDIDSPNIFMLWYFFNLTKSVIVIEAVPTDLAQSENNTMLKVDKPRGVSNLIISDTAYRNREISQEIEVESLQSNMVGNRVHIYDALRDSHYVRLLKVLPLNVLYPDMILEKMYWAAVLGLGTKGHKRTVGEPGTLPFDKARNLRLDTTQQININIVLIDDLNQFILKDGFNYGNLQDRIGENVSKLPSEFFVEDQVLPARVFLLTAMKNQILVQERLLPAKLLYDEKFYTEAHNAELLSGSEATSFCYNYIDVKPSIEKSNNVISGGGHDNFAHKVRNSQDLHPTQSETE